MIFLTIADLRSKIKTNVLSDSLELTNVITPNNELLTMVEKDSIEMLKIYLSNIYDTNSFLQQTGEDRNRVIVNILCDMVIYELLSRITTDIIPEVIENKYNKTMQLLKDIRDQKVSLNIPQKNLNYDSWGGMVWHSDKKNHYDY
jgi:phage gp36-like protein